MLIRVEMNRLGDIEMVPVSEKAIRAYAAHMREWHPGTSYRSDREAASAYLQGDAVLAFLEDCTPRQRRDIDGGWTIRIRMDPWYYGHCLGYDAHHVEW